jgi:hypothetical protein
MPILASRGTAYYYKGKGVEKYKLEPDPFKQEKAKQDTLAYAIIFTGFTLNEQEVTAKVSCLNDQRVMYTFGKGFGDISVSGEVLCGAPEDQGGGEQALVEYYETNRVGVLKSPITLSGPKGFTAEFFLTGLTISQYNTQLEILNFRFNGVLAK